MRRFLLEWQLLAILLSQCFTCKGARSTSSSAQDTITHCTLWSLLMDRCPKRGKSESRVGMRCSQTGQSTSGIMLPGASSALSKRSALSEGTWAQPSLPTVSWERTKIKASTPSFTCNHCAALHEKAGQDTTHSKVILYSLVQRLPNWKNAKSSSSHPFLNKAFLLHLLFFLLRKHLCFYSKDFWKFRKSVLSFLIKMSLVCIWSLPAFFFSALMVGQRQGTALRR